MSLPVILTHYGNIDYLSRTLECAQLTNGSKTMVLIGDEANRETATDRGWEHVLIDEYQSNLRTRFGEVFKHVQGARHHHIKNGRDWLRFVFERWFVVLEYCERNQIFAFWHFDSDVLLLEDLIPFEQELLKSVAFTRQCDDTCLNGIVTLSLLREFCFFVIDLFLDESFLNSQQQEFDTVHPEWAFTEMRAFQLFSQSPRCRERGIALESSISNWWFDDCICLEDGFEMKTLRDRKTVVKRVVAENGRFFGIHEGSRIQFAVLNLSWVPTEIFDWVIREKQRKAGSRGRPREIELRAEPVSKMLSRSIKNVAKLVLRWLGLRHETKGIHR